MLRLHLMMLVCVNGFCADAIASIAFGEVSEGPYMCPVTSHLYLCRGVVLWMGMWFECSLA